ncbi:hypothetical protein LCGC14_2309030, partial [marine sediment metagenome]
MRHFQNLKAAEAKRMRYILLAYLIAGFVGLSFGIALYTVTEIRLTTTVTIFLAASLALLTAYFLGKKLVELVDKKVKVSLTVCGETSESYHAVEEFKVTYCKKLDDDSCQKCLGTIKVPRDSALFISACITSDEQMEGKLRHFCCDYGQRPSIEIIKKTTIKEFFCHQILDRIVSGDNDEEVNNTALNKRVYHLSSKRVEPGNYSA